MAARSKVISTAAGLVALLWAVRFCAAGVGPDVIVVDLDAVDDYSRDHPFAVLSMKTESCNAGDELLQWQALPSNEHPVIAQNMYRLKDGRLEQIGQAWVKHGFSTFDSGTCGLCDGNLGQVLGVGCSDPYGANLNRGPFLGPRGEVNPVTGSFDGATANDHSSHLHTGISHGLQVMNDDLANAGAGYFVEGHYVTADDALAGNGNNNASYRKVLVTGSAFDWHFANDGPTVQESPAIFAWTGASFSILDSWPVDGRLIVAYNTSDLGGGQTRYEYAVYNMNSERAVRSFSVPIGSATVTNIGFKPALSHDEGFPEDPVNAPWTTSIAAGTLTWSTETFATDPNTSAIRWGTMFNFWFDADTTPVNSAAALGRFKPGTGADVIFAAIVAPAPADCDDNGQPDEAQIAADPALDCNLDGFLDACQLDGNDCNTDGRPDDCQLADNDCNGDSTPDDCQLVDNDCNGNFVPDECESDCDGDGIVDACTGEPDCNGNGVPDSCDIAGEVGGLFNHLSGTIGEAFGSSPTTVSHSIDVTESGTISDINVGVDVAHTWVGDLMITLQHGGTVVVLWSGGTCESNDDLVATFDDAGSFVSCGMPTTGTIAPISAGGGNLSDFNGQDPLGSWTLTIQDTFAAQDNGIFNNWSLTVETATVPSFSEDTNGNTIPDDCECNASLGDMNGDGTINALDIQAFLDAYLVRFSACADMHGDGPPLTEADVQAFVAALLQRRLVVAPFPAEFLGTPSTVP